MKMKKTIAGVLAAMTAVSAMAATVSADQEEINLHYDLRTKVTTKDDAKVTVVENWAQSQTQTYQTNTTSYDLNGDGTNDVLNVFKFGFVNSDVKDVNRFGDVVSARVTFTYAQPNSNGIGTTNTKTIVYKNIADITDADYTSGQFVVPVVVRSGIGYIADGNGNEVPFWSNDTDSIYVPSNVPNGFSTVDFGTLTNASVSITYKVPGYYDGSDISGWEFWWNANNQAWIFDPNTQTWQYNSQAYYNPYELQWLGISATSEKAQSIGNINNGLISTQSGINFNGTLGFGGLEAGKKVDHYFPLMSTSSVYRYGAKYNLAANQAGKDVVTNDVIAAIRRSGSGTSPLSVINDAIANDYDVEFTFTSANGHVATLNSTAVLQWVNFGEAYDYDVKNSWNKTVFGQDLYSSKIEDPYMSSPYQNAIFKPEYSYNASKSYDSYGSYSSAWAQNLVSAGLVVNSELTMQLNDVQKLQWDANTLTFHWDDIIDGKVTRANQILTTMLLYTPIDWYWDSLDIKVLKTETEDVNAGESIEEDGEILDEEIDEEVEEEVEEEEEVVEEEEEYVEEEEVEEELPEVEVEEEPVETTAAPVEAAPSPKTGNAPIALAVIPVALAAAAVVAKKRG